MPVTRPKCPGSDILGSVIKQTERGNYYADTTNCKAIEEFCRKCSFRTRNHAEFIKVKEKAVYADGRETNLSGREAYGLYGLEVGKMIADGGGRTVFAAATNTLVIGEGELKWDMVAIAEYASLESFQKIMSTPEYQEIAKHREAGLEYQLLINLKTR